MAEYIADSTFASQHNNVNVGDLILDASQEPAGFAFYLRRDSAETLGGGAYFDWIDQKLYQTNNILIRGSSTLRRFLLYFGGLDPQDEGGNHIITITNFDGQIWPYEACGILGLKNFRLTSEYNIANQTGDPNYLGWDSGYEFRRGRFGMVFSGLQFGTDTYYTTGDHGCDQFELDNIESAYAYYAGVSLKNDNVGDPTATMKNCSVHHCYVHDQYQGEGIYWGNTQAVPQHTIKDTVFHNNIFVRSSREILQLGRLGQGFRAYNNVAGYSAMGWLLHTSDVQRGGVQFQCRDGDSWLYDNILLAGMSHFSDITVGADAKSLSPNRVFNNYIGCGKWKTYSFLSTAEGALAHEVSGNHIGHTTNVYDRIKLPGDPRFDNDYPDFVYSTNIYDDFDFDNNICDFSHVNIYPAGISSNHQQSGTIRQTFERPVFKNSGWDDANFDPNDFEIWTPTINNDERMGENAYYPTGFIVAHREDDTIIVNGDPVTRTVHKYYRKLTDNTALVEPGVSIGWENDWELLTWTDGTIIYEYPPDDFRLADTSIYKPLGMGLIDTEVQDDPFPVGSLQASDENYQKTTLFTTNGQISELRNRHYNTSVFYFNNFVYFTYIDTDSRPKIVQAAKDSSTYNESYLDSGSDYTIPNDSHYTFSIGVDTDGYIHVSGGMHNHRHNYASTNDILPDRYKNSFIMYWKSTQPQNISNFDFVGHETDTTRPEGYAFSYVQFHHDMNGVLYMKSRIYVYEGTHYEGEVGLAIYKYNTISKTWEALGGLAPTTHGNVAIYKCVFWEDNGEWWQSQPSDHTRSFYQSLYNGLSFDRQNRMHFCYTINNLTDNKNSTEVIYWMSDNGGSSFKKANGAVINAPIRASGSINSGDIVGVNGRYTGDAWVDVDWAYRPIIAYSEYTDQNSSSPNSPPKTRIYRNGVWEEAIDMQLSAIYGSGVGSDDGGIFMYWALNNSTSQAYIYRTRRYGEEGYSINVGGEMSGFDWTTFKKTGDLFLCSNDGINMNLIKVRFTVEDIIVAIKKNAIKMLLA